MSQKFIREDFGGNYTDNNDCPIARAIKRLFKPYDVRVYPNFLFIKQTEEEDYVVHYFKTIRLNGKTLKTNGFTAIDHNTIKEFVDAPEFNAEFSISKNLSVGLLSERDIRYINNSVEGKREFLNKK